MNSMNTSSKPTLVVQLADGTQIALVSRRQTPSTRLPVPGGFVDNVGEVLSLVDRARAGDANAKARLATWDADHDQRKALMREVHEEGFRG
jgi:ADP-ribose pyrophosphatase YjhB (NUDIX family)